VAAVELHAMGTTNAVPDIDFNSIFNSVNHSGSIGPPPARTSFESPPSSDMVVSISSAGDSDVARLSPIPALRKLDNGSRFCNLYYTDLYQVLKAQMAPQAATAIADYLDRYKATRETTSALRATQILPFSSEYRQWPLVSWREGDDVDVMALFKILGEPGSPASCLLFYGNERCWGADGQRWKASYIAWSVTSIEHIRELFLAAAHVAGRIIPAQYLFSEGSGSPSKEEYILSCNSNDFRLYKCVEFVRSQLSIVQAWEEQFTSIEPHLRGYSERESLPYW